MNSPDPAISAEERAALAWTQSARFLTTASRLDQLPPPGLPETAFVGRSNAGKAPSQKTQRNPPNDRSHPGDP